MNTLKTVFGKLFKEETQLASHEVELGKIDDLNKILEEVRGSGKSISATGRKSVSALINTTFPLIDQTRKKIQQAIKDFDLISKQAKDLGIEVPPNISANLKQAIAEDNDLFELRKAIEKFELSYLDLTQDF
jgi:hypothetical protein